VRLQIGDIDPSARRIAPATVAGLAGDVDFFSSCQGAKRGDVRLIHRWQAKGAPLPAKNAELEVDLNNPLYRGGNA
jgi:hypothetical protein